MLVGLVVERDVAADHRAVNSAGSVAEAPYRLGELPVDLGVDRGGKVEAVDERDRDGAGAGQVRGVLEDGIPGPLVRLEVDLPGVAAAGEDQRSRTEPEDGGVVPHLDGSDLDVVVVLLEDPAPVRDLGVGEDEERELAQGALRPDQRPLGRVRLLGERAARRPLYQDLHGQIADDLVPERDDIPGLGDHLADLGPGEVVALREPADQADVVGSDLEAHPLLALGEHDLDRVHAGLPEMDLIGADVTAVGRAHLRGRAGEPGGAEVAAAEDLSGRDHGEDPLDQEFLGVGVADLDRGAVRGLGVLGEVARGERGAAEAVAARGGADKDKLAPRTLDPAGDVAVGRDRPDADNVDERVARVGRVHDHLAPDHGDADAVAVAPDPLDHSREETAVLLVLERAEVERVHQGDRPGAHGEDVADDAADAGCRAVVRVDVARVIVALHPDGERDVVREPDDRRVVPGTDEHVRAGGRQRPEQVLGRAVRAVLGPEVLEAGDFDRRGIPAEQPLCLGEVGVGQHGGSGSTVAGIKAWRPGRRAQPLGPPPHPPGSAPKSPSGQPQAMRCGRH